MTLRPCDESVVPAKATKDQWGRKWYEDWFYYKVGTDIKLQSTWKHIRYIPQPKVVLDATTRTRISLLQTLSSKISMCYLVEEFCAANIHPLRQDWQVGGLLTTAASGETVLSTSGLPGMPTSPMRFALVISTAFLYLLHAPRCYP